MTTHLQRKKVYDPLLRLLHWGMVLCVFMLLGTAWSHELFEDGVYEKPIWILHINAGYVLVALFAVRILWGIVGPRHARFSDFWHPREWIQALKRPSFGLGNRFGHHPMASLAYLSFYAVLLIMIATGLGLAAMEQSTGPLTAWLSEGAWYEDLFEEPHEALAILIVVFIGVHLGAMLLHERLEKIPVFQAMLSGYQYREVKIKEGAQLAGPGTKGSPAERH